MKAEIRPKDIDLVILCGGLGRRLSSVTKHIPKPMAKMGSRPFLDLIIEHALSFGVRRFVLCTGHKAEIIENYYSDKKQLDIVFSHENVELGTGGAIKNARPHIKTNPFFVMNGDSLCRIDLQNFLEFAIERESLISIVLTMEGMQNDVGSVKINEDGRISEFFEKGEYQKTHYVNAGVYIFSKDVFSYMPDTSKFSLEYDFFPEMTGKDAYGYVVSQDFIDIGTPETYEAAKRKLGR